MIQYIVCCQTAEYYVLCLCLHRRHDWKVERKALLTIDFESAKADMGCKMMKKINWKKAIFSILLGMFGLQAAGCGGSDAGNTTADKEFVYVPEYQKLKAENGADQVFVDGDMIYYRTGSYDEEKQEYTEYLAMLKIGGDTPEMIPLDFGANSSIQQVGTDGEGNFYAIVSTYTYEEEQ
ncbi:MAG TPA: hypothetical protein DCZ40_05095, partial [Lachnospiraceae bacterium]|nr:hypothetical protein [Lachnospiraceae bacterium]